MKNNLLTVSELAEVLNCSVSTIYRMVRNNLIPYYDMMSSYRFDLEEVKAVLHRK